MLTWFLSVVLLVSPPASHARQPIADPVLRTTRAALEPYIATNGDGFLVVWEDDRYGNYDIFAGRYDADGRPLDASGFLVHATWRPEYDPSAVWDGERYLALGPAEHMGTFPVAIEEDGRVEDAGALFPATVGFQRSLGWNGTHYAAVMTDGPTSTASFVLLNRQLEVVSRTVLPDPSYLTFNARVATGGDGFLVVWETIRNGGREDLLFGQTFSDFGAPTGEPRLLASEAVREEVWDTPGYPGRLHPALSWNGTAWTVVWTMADGVYRARWTPDGAPEIARLFEERDPSYATIAWDGSVHLVAWNRRIDISQGFDVQPYAAVVSSTGVVAHSFPVGERQAAPFRLALASNGRIFLLVAYGQRFVIRPWPAPGTVVAKPFTTEVYTPQTHPALAAGTANLLGAWQEDGAIYAGRLDRGGRPLDGGGIRVAEVGTFVNSIRVASTGDTWLVVWEDAGSAVRGARITAAGELLDAGGFDIAPGGSAPVAAGRGDAFLVVWREPEVPAFQNSDLFAAAIPARGPVEIRKQPPLAEKSLVDQPIALLAGDDGFHLLAQRTPFCFGRTCPSPMPHEQWLATLRPDGTAVEEHLLLSRQTIHGAFLRHGVVFTVVRNGPFHFVRRFTLDGETVGSPIELDIPPNPLKIALVPSATGATVLVTPQPGDTRAIFLDRDGAPQGPSVVVVSGTDAPILSDAVFDGRHVWLTYTTWWQPLPHNHTGVVTRAYVARLAGRVRAAGR